jgi:threonine/homoserine/homoserine lactone efflux protein
VTETTSLPLFLLSVFAISLTGAMMPGPVTAVAVANGAQHKEAGVLIAIGHGLVEIPVILLIYFGLASFMNLDGVRIAVGLIGGAVLIWMGLNMFKNKPSIFSEQKVQYRNSVVAGLTLTAANPYFFVWWATVGAALLVSARDFGGTGVAALSATHWFCDLAWLFFISWIVFKSKRLWTKKVNTTVFGICSAILIGFGAWFIISSISLAVSA